MKKLIAWFNENILQLWTLILLAFIPLYPKFPLIDIQQTWVYIRLEDFLVALAIGSLIVIIFRKHSLRQSPLTFPIFVYWGVGCISLLQALLFLFPHFQGVLMPHLAIFHYLRRIEYMSLFFLAYEAYKKKSRIEPYVSVIVATYFCVLLYGIGQKFFGFPAFLTMNEEFSKGIPLRLPATARIPATFGGHYDFAAYLVLTIPIMGSLYFGVKKIWEKSFFVALTLLGLLLLLFTASRISFGVYLISMSCMLMWQKKPILIPFMILISIGLLNITSGASERFYKTFRVSNVVVDLSTGKPIGALDKFEGASATIQKIESPDEENLPKGSGFINLPAGYGASQLDNQDKKSIDTIKTVEMYITKNLAVGSGEFATISGSFLIQKALVYDISITTRLQGQWPKAVAAFKRNILLGSGFSSLSIAADGDYHRMLGETGLIGTIAFLGIFAVLYVLFFLRKETLIQKQKAFTIGIFSGLTGLFFNAVFIDVFEASKVAFMLWLLLGISVALLTQKKPFIIRYFQFLIRIATHPMAYTAYLVLFIFLIWGKSISGYFIGDDFTWLRWAAESSSRDIFQYFSDARGFFYRPIPKLWYFILFSTFWLKPWPYHVLSLLLFSISVIFLISIMKMRKIRSFIVWGSALIYSILSVHHENLFWISGQSCLLSLLFISSSVYVFLTIWEIKKDSTCKRFLTIIAVGTLLFSMFSYDGVLTAPLVISLIAITLYRQKLKWLFISLLIPLYWYLRVHSGAVMPSGDYGYKLSTLFLNEYINGIGYILSFVFGPSVMDKLYNLRNQLRMYVFPIRLVSGIGFVCIIAAAWRLRRYWSRYKESLIWFVCSILMLSPYAGLGNMSERYATIPFFFLTIAIAEWVNTYLEKRISWMAYGITVILYCSVIWMNLVSISKVAYDWERASYISENSLLMIKNEAFPLKRPTTFIFVNTPIRYGRAWIFPTGLGDAIWHMFRQGPYTTVQLATTEQAYAYPLLLGERDVYIFDDYLLKRIMHEVKEVQ